MLRLSLRSCKTCYTDTMYNSLKKYILLQGNELFNFKYTCVENYVNIFEALQYKRQKQIYFDLSIMKLRISRGCDNLTNHFQDNQRVISPRLLSAQASNFKICFTALKARQWAGFLVLPCLSNCYLLGRNLDTKYSNL